MHLILYIEANQQITNSEGWIIKSGQQQAVMVPPWVVEEEEKVLHLCLVGFLKSSLGGIREVESWLTNTWGRKPIDIKLLETDTVLLQVSSNEEVEEVICCAKDSPSSPFIVIDRWMEVIGSPPPPRWIKFCGVPLHAWREGIFQHLGDVLGRTLEVDPHTTAKEVLTHGSIKVLLGKVGRLPKEIPLWIGDLQVSVLVEEDQEDPNDFRHLSSISRSLPGLDSKMKGQCYSC